MIGKLPLQQFESAYANHFGVTLVPASYGHPSVVALLQAVTHVIAIRGKGFRRTILLQADFQSETVSAVALPSNRRATRVSSRYSRCSVHGPSSVLIRLEVQVSGLELACGIALCLIYLMFIRLRIILYLKLYFSSLVGRRGQKQRPNAGEDHQHAAVQRLRHHGELQSFRGFEIQQIKQRFIVI